MKLTKDIMILEQSIERRLIPCFDGEYEATACGRIWSNKSGKFLKQRIQQNGYVTVKAAGKNRTVHRLIAAAYLPNLENKPTVNHINGNKSDNSVKNLEWATMQEQAVHAFAAGLRISPVGERSGASKLTTGQVLDIRTRYSEGLTQQELGDAYGVSRSTISHVVRGGQWKHLPIDSNVYKMASRRSAEATRSLELSVVRELRLKHLNGSSIRGLSLEYGIPYSTMNYLLNFRTYSDFDTDLRKSA